MVFKKLEYRLRMQPKGFSVQAILYDSLPTSKHFVVDLSGRVLYSEQGVREGLVEC